MPSVDSSTSTTMTNSNDIRCSETDSSIEDTSMSKHDSPKLSSGFVRCSLGPGGTSQSTWNRRELREESARLEVRNIHLRDILNELKAKKERIEVLMPGFIADTQGPIM
ncbi:unnamed protein product [Meganyctiphanes norvegica]|uniref:Uncharacterized protein n=1 Tax=Meganyctiphanes norvegica TaxID=48144 RepID=A0AAV2QVW1_MEGNR